ncbi:MAG: hypothetical protein Fur0022_05340 [Anaerolineales bacterium]
MKTSSKNLLLLLVCLSLAAFACRTGTPAALPEVSPTANPPAVLPAESPTPTLAPTDTSTPLPTPTEIPPTPTSTPIPVDFRINDFRKKSFILIVAPSAPNTLYAKSEDAAYISTDGGTSWRSLGEAELAGLPVPVLNQIFQYDIARKTIDPSSPTTWYDVFQHVLKKSVDGGQTWEEINNQAWMTGIDALIAVDPSNPQTLFWGIWDGLYRSGDGGMTWSKVIPGSMSQMAVSVFSMIVFDPLSPNTIYTIDTTTGLYKSTDNGISWKHLSGGNFPYLNQWLVIDPANSNVLYAKDYNRTLYTSADGGATWQATNLGLPVNDIAWLAIDPINPALRYAIVNQGEFSGLFKSTDGGQTWAEIPAVLLP